MGIEITDQKRAIFLFSDAQVDKAIEIGLGGQEKTILFPFRLDLCVRLESLGLPYHTPWKYISDQDRMLVSAEGSRIMDRTEELEVTIRKIRGSRSWRLTKPLRTLTDLLRRIRKRTMNVGDEFKYSNGPV